MLKTVGTSGQLTLGKKYSGRHFELEELKSGELVLRPVKLVRDTATAARAKGVRHKGACPPSFKIAEVEQVVMPARDQRNARSR
ncbi:MAG: hypothetical protein EXR39_11270 [Betaproteobacteria bacterium]|nr:hypothetical protein [Betaproteobacteria bacterium]